MVEVGTIFGIITTWAFVIAFLICLYLTIRREKKPKVEYTPRARKDLEEYLKKRGEE